MMPKIKPSYVFLAIAILLVFVNPLATVAAGYNQESSLVAAGVYTSYRVISRLVSMVAETQIEASAVVASVTFMPGKTLQSLLDTLQRFGDMMFPLMIVSGVLGVIIVPAAKLGAGLAAFGLVIHVALGHVERISGAVRVQLQRLAHGLVSIGILIALIFVGLPFVTRTVQPVIAEIEQEVEEASATLGAGRFHTLRRVILPMLLPAALTGFALSLARAVGEYGSVIFIAGNLPMKTEIAPLLIVIKLEEFDYDGAAAIGIAMLLISFAMLLAINLIQIWSRRRIGHV